MMPRLVQLFLPLLVLILTGGCVTTQRTKPVEKSASLIYPAGIQVDQTSDDASYGYTLGNPVQVGTRGMSGSAAAIHTYLSHLRDRDFNLLRFKHIKTIEGGSDWPTVAVYELIGEDAQMYQLYLEVTDSSAHPLDSLAPMGMYLYR